MKKMSLKVLTLTIALATASLVVADTSDDSILNEIAGYRQWPRINPQPIVTGLDAVAI